MEKRGGVWICPEGHVPHGRMVDPDSADLWVSWQDGRALEDETVCGAEAAIAWGRERSSVVMIRLGHTGGTYFSAGDEHPADESTEKVPHWPPVGPSAGGRWYPPPPRTRDEVMSVAAAVGRGEMTRSQAAAWADERMALFAPDLDRAMLTALIELREEVAGR